MHRAIGRALRGTCRKWRENECPVASGEEVRRKKEDDNKKDFVPPKHTLEDAVACTAVLALGYQLSQNRRHHKAVKAVSSTSVADNSTVPAKPSLAEVPLKSSCPFAASKLAFTQPIFGVGSSFNVKGKTASTVIPSIDVTPFMHDYTRELAEIDEGRCSQFSDSDDDSVIFAEDPPSSPVPKLSTTKHELNQFPASPTLTPSSSTSSIDGVAAAAEYGRRFGGDLLSILGAVEFLQAEASPKSPKETKTGKKLKKKSSPKVSEKDPLIHAIDLMKKGADLGSGRALYNIGVAYDRMEDMALAKEYYKKAADVGHPLAIYNCAVLALKEGHLSEGYALMKTASDYGVPEAKNFMNPADGTMNASLTNLQVGNA